MMFGICQLHETFVRGFSVASLQMKICLIILGRKVGQISSRKTTVVFLFFFVFFFSDFFMFSLIFMDMQIR